MADNSDTGAATSQGSGEGSGNSRFSKMGKKTKIMYIVGLVLLVIVLIAISIFVIRKIFGGTEKGSTSVASSMVTQNLKKSAAAVPADEGKSKKGSKDKSAESPDTKNSANTETNNIRNVEISFSEPGSKADSNVVKKKPSKKRSGDKRSENKQDGTINSGAVQLSNMLGVNDIRLVAGKASNLVSHA
ncbi:uncharacterized protein NESG_01531 [Nematocida ausubeli]|uniref:Uncharacterized protein n=1 Tax=Nematocida ausubeli (strain ATCC PRA-371 / ERTm2) TaxID=1913371 RepID=A0A086J2P0_NEMA1|nr:uncharacterized protein NESG_01531 [Nematocida ausubeli]KAI5134683.1 hypothetical protein NEAUS06_1242 [Nematocida ausubeli]KFG26408.1 hypothetical protein NESG_01531 [Nematocida ausubeli]